MRNGYNIDTLTSVDMQEIVKICGKFVEVYCKMFRTSPFKEVFEKLLNSSKNIKKSVTISCND